MIQFQAMKFRVKSPEHSKKIQEKLFETGYRWYRWYGGTQIIDKLNSPYLFTDTFGQIRHRPDIEFPFEEDDGVEHELVEIVTHTSTLLPVPKKDVVIFDGKEYNKGHFKELLEEVIGKL